MSRFKSTYLKAIVYGANDGIVTTFAVVAGVAGAGLSPKIIIILGVANMVADGISMAVGDYLGERSLQMLEGQRNGTALPKKIWMTGLLTFVSFLVAGSLPLMPYFLKIFGLRLDSENQFLYSIASTALALFMIGSMRSLLIKRSWIYNGLEMLGVGSIAASAAYFLGLIIERLVGA